jgi:hypothetical protein
VLIFYTLNGCRHPIDEKIIKKRVRSLTRTAYPNPYHMTLGSSYFLEFKNYVSGQFQRTNLGTPQRMGHIIGTCDGMLLLRNSSNQIFFVNPLLKCWLRLPYYPISLQRPTVFKYQGTIARVPRSSKFKLFLADCIEILGVFWYVLYVLRIGKDNSWKEIFRKESPLQRHFKCQALYSEVMMIFTG